MSHCMSGLAIVYHQTTTLGQQGSKKLTYVVINSCFVGYCPLHVWPGSVV